jgi:hypothetical protein
VEKLSDMEYGYDTDVDLGDLLSAMDLDEDDELEMYERNKILDAIDEVQSFSASHRDEVDFGDFFDGMPDDLGFDLGDF